MFTLEEFYVWETGKVDIQLSKNFFNYEFETDESKPRITILSKALLNKLQAVREEFGRAITFTSAYRSQLRQDQLKAAGYPTAKGLSGHETGTAADIDTSKMSEGERQALLRILGKYFMAIGIAKTFIHVDLRADKQRVWTY